MCSPVCALGIAAVTYIVHILVSGVQSVSEIVNAIKKEKVYVVSSTGTWSLGQRSVNEKQRKQEESPCKL